MVLTNPRYLHLHISLLDTITETIAYKLADKTSGRIQTHPTSTYPSKTPQKRKKLGQQYFFSSLRTRPKHRYFPMNSYNTETYTVLDIITPFGAVLGRPRESPESINDRRWSRIATTLQLAFPINCNLIKN